MERAETEVSRVQSTEIMTYKDGEGPKIVVARKVSEKGKGWTERERGGGGGER